MSIIDYIRENYPYVLVEDCSERGCKLRVDLGNHVIIKGEEMCKNQKICDHIVFGGCQVLWCSSHCSAE